MEVLGYIVLYLMLVAAGWFASLKGTRFVIKLFPLFNLFSSWWQRRKESSASTYINIEYMNVTFPSDREEDKKDKS